MIIHYCYCRTVNRGLPLTPPAGAPAAAEDDHSRIVARVLNTHPLGEHVASHWRLQDVMRWVPALDLTVGQRVHTNSLERQSRRLLEGGITSICQSRSFCTTSSLADAGVDYAQEGWVTHRLFPTRVILHLFLPGSPFELPDVLHVDALRSATYYSGLNGPSVRGTWPGKYGILNIECILDEFVIKYGESSSDVFCISWFSYAMVSLLSSYFTQTVSIDQSQGDAGVPCCTPPPGLLSPVILLCLDVLPQLATLRKR